MPADSIVIPEATHLAAEMDEIQRCPRIEAVQRVKALRAHELERIAQQRSSFDSGEVGAGIVGLITGMTDAVVKTLARRAFQREGAGPNCFDHVSVLALGGYGRGEMNPYSDVDVLVLSGDSKIPAWASAGNAEFQALLWDVGFQVGASMRSVSELERILKDDYVTATAVIEQRLLLGDQKLAGQVENLLERFRAKRARDFLLFKLDELTKRRSQTGASVFVMESNLKSNPGCLRDVQLLRNVAFIVCGARDLRVLEQLDVITSADLDKIASTNDHLLEMRSLLHFHHKSKKDVFELADQLRIAEQFGYQDLSQLRAVERLMKEHYARVLHVHQMMELCVSRLRARGYLGRKPILVLSRRVLDKDFTSVEGRVYLSHDDFWRHPDATARLMRMCRTAQQRGMRISLELQRAIRNHLALVDDVARADYASGRVFLSILGDIGRVKPILSDMHNAGLLGAFLPEFGNLTCHMQFSSYHQYTVDEHTLIAVGHLDDVANGELSGLPGMVELLKSVKRPDLLTLGLLLHDMGKYMGRGHVPRGAIMVGPVAKRMGFDEAEEELLYFLVERHVILSDASRMRDFHEPGFLKTFCEKFSNRTQLDMLYCLTFCDAKAVGEGILTGWQEALLTEIYAAVAEKLSPTSTPGVSHHERLRQALTRLGLSQDDAQRHLDDLPDNYVYHVSENDIKSHVEVLEQCRKEGVGLVRDLKADEVAVVTASVPDRHALFADITATLTGHGFNILDVRTWITRAGQVLYQFRLEHLFPDKLSEDRTWKRLRDDMLAVSKNTLSAVELMNRRGQAIGVSAPADSQFKDPAVKFEQLTSSDHTIIDIHAKDEPGLLSKLCRTISRSGCDIGYACINTMGDVAVDVFYVTRKGAKLSDEDANALKQDLINSLQLTVASP
jgi:[protein-PII] uridylyltransferase